MSTVETPRPRLLWLLALMPVVLAYSNVLDVGFMWDDHVLIEQNAELHVLHAPWDYLGRSFWQHRFAYGLGHAFYRPLTTFSLALDYAVGGGGPAWFHVTNLLMHLGVCSFVFWFALARGRDALTAAAVTSLFGVMPRLTESVTWIVGRTDVLATLLVLAAAWVAQSSSPRVRPLSAALLFFALLAKEVALIGVLLVAAERLLALSRRETALRAELATGGALVAAVVTWAVLRGASGSAAPLRLHDAGTFLGGLGHYALMVLTPWNPVAQLGFVKDVDGWAVALGLLTLAAVGFATVRWVRTREAWRAVWLLGALGGAVMVSLVVLTVYTIASDRFLYLPLALGAVVAAQRSWPKPALGAGVAAVLGLAAVTWQRNVTWADPLRFWGEVYRTASPKNPGAPNGLGDALFELERIEDAVPFFLEAERARGRVPESPTRLSLAVAASRLGRDAEALAQLDVILGENPKWRRAWYDLVLFRARALDFAGARAALAQLRERFGDDEVLRDFERLLAENEPKVQSPTLIERARGLQALGATAKAQALYRQALDAPDTAPEAAKWLVVFGSRADADRGRALLAGDEAVERAWAARFATPVPPPRSP